jgi:hypothetical protein
MILEIALGIVLAVLILACLPLILTLGLAAIAIVAVVALAVLAFVFVKELWNIENLGALLLIAGVIGWCWIATVVETRTQDKVQATEFLGLTVLVPLAGYFLMLSAAVLRDADQSGYDLVPYLIAFAATATAISVLVWRIRVRYRQ